MSKERRQTMQQFIQLTKT